MAARRAGGQRRRRLATWANLGPRPWFLTVPRPPEATGNSRDARHSLFALSGFSVTTLNRKETQGMTTQMFDVQLRGIDEIRPYDRNPRQNDQAVDAVAASLKEIGRAHV